jgi:hypothetical protein
MLLLIKGVAKGGKKNVFERMQEGRRDGRAKKGGDKKNKKPNTVKLGDKVMPAGFFCSAFR